MERESRDEFLLATPAAVFELYVWLQAGAQERRDAWVRDKGAFTARTKAQMNMCRRIGAALEWYLVRRLPFEKAPWDGFLHRGPDEIGIVLFERYLAQQLEHWEAARLGGAGEAEAMGRSEVVREARSLFCERTGLEPNVIRRRGELLEVERDWRIQDDPNRGLVSTRALGPLPPEDLRAAARAAKGGASR